MSENLNTATKKEKRGGTRKNAGAKPILDKKIQVSFYIEQSKIDKMGGLEEFKLKILTYIDRSALRSFKHYLSIEAIKHFYSFCGMVENFFNKTLAN